MKKKTTITTEKLEVWIIRQPFEQTIEQEIDIDETSSMSPVLDGFSDPDTTSEQEQN